MYTVEYLVTFDQNTRACQSEHAFAHLLCANDDISIRSNKLRYKEQQFAYSVTSGNVEGKAQRYFDIQLSTQSSDQFENLNEALRAIRTLVIQAGGALTPVRDDTALHWASELYPRIHRVENSLRLLITKFMLMKVGIEWIQEATPIELKSLTGGTKFKHESFLHSTDFLHLGDFLFKPYSQDDYIKVFKEVASSRSKKDINLKRLREVLPRSNWDRYFSEIIDCDGGHLEKQWRLLYEYRCKVAHNNFISRREFDEASGLLSEVEDIIGQAISRLGQISVPSGERSEVYESVVSSINEALGHFINRWKVFERQFDKLRIQQDLREKASIREILGLLLQQGKISREFYALVMDMIAFRNLIIHGSLQTVDTTNLDHWSVVLERVIASLRMVTEKS